MVPSRRYNRIGHQWAKFCKEGAWEETNICYHCAHTSHKKKMLIKVDEIYNIAEKITLITATLKLDLHQLAERGLGWDDQIPENLKLSNDGRDWHN